ncbi:MAG: hypothetical protein ABI051_12410 [Vicinamibacterales bacterium]
MALPTGAKSASDDTAPRVRTFVLIVLVEVVTLASLYWFGVHFS